MKSAYEVLNTSKGIARFNGKTIEFVDSSEVILLNQIYRYRISPLGYVKIWCKGQSSFIKVRFNHQFFLSLDDLYLLKMFFLLVYYTCMPKI